MDPEDETLAPETIEPQPTNATLEWARHFTTNWLEMFGTSVRAAIEYAFAVEASELRRRTASRRSTDCYLYIRNTDPDWGVRIRFDSDEVVVEPPDPWLWLTRLLDTESIRRERDSNPPGRGHLWPEPIEVRLLFPWGPYGGVPAHLFGDWPRYAVHLPANRTGIMLSRQVLAGAVIRQSATAAINPTDFEALPGTSADLLTLLLSSQDLFQRRRRDNSRLQALVKEFEKCLRAEIVVEERANSADTVMAVTPEGAFPLTLISSMLSELAPLLLVLKGPVGKGDHLTIDEPEAHLHPEMQRAAASFIAGVVNCGVQVVLTTHSDFFLGELNNLIRSGRLTDPQNSLPMGRRSEFESSNVCALRFSRGDRWCVGDPLAVDPVDGIDESTFTDVMESLYDESVRLIDELS